MLKSKFGGGSISPAIASHLKKVALKPVLQTVLSSGNVKFGGGSISPSVSSHLAKKMGGGSISPTVAAHLAKRNIAKK